ncbi:diguanylate cyclase (GGDEF)-like protein [Paenibacillus shirakamiensis]|uniref:Diguanylate cyclase (GGDEF)-like protein n=1 Tax=Paenibacillus shirakamiensis TaxID=1265935 RepID=A0ABS4JMN9_9BACL|nr:histidine kinase N-terminal 7TM domain-containing protein [Paenibacillus shirakamiensis]MBP2002396.1 diguanylate cyclase (GGDEF)-like protein [Paenibacillus shirakamiensis]
MNSITTYITLVTTSGVLSIFLCIYAWLRRKEIPGSHLFILWTLSSAIYIFAVAFGLASSSLTLMMFWTKIEYIGMPYIPVLGLLLVFRYMGWRLSRWKLALLFIIPILTTGLVATNEWHHLFYKSIYLRTDTATPIANTVIGPWYIVHGAFTFSCLLAGTILLARQWTSTKKAYRLQLTTLICGQMLPMIASFIYLMGLTPGGIDPVPMVMCLTSALYIWALITTRLLTIIPIAKERIFESMRDGVVVLDSSNRIIDYNQALLQFIPSMTPKMIGQSLDEVWGQLTGKAFPARYAVDGSEEVAWNSTTYVQVRSSVIKLRNNEEAGRLLMLVDVTQQTRLEEQLRYLAYHDELTQIYNRTHFIQTCKQLLQHCDAIYHPLSIILFDVDHFKQINDTYGHELGDRALQHVVQVCLSVIDSDSFLARYGGEEFVVALPDLNLDQAGIIAEKIRASLEATPMMIDQHPVLLTSSFGVSTAGDGADTPLEFLLRDADEALYLSKRNGRNAVHLHHGRVSSYIHGY